MGTSLTGTKPKDTYDSLIKVTDNGPLSGTAKYLSDGLGNDSALAVSTTAVGVGTNVPAFPLEVYNNSATAYTTSSRGNSFRLYNPNSGADIFAGIEFGGAGTANDGLCGINGVVTGSGSAALTFYTRDANTFAEKVRITSAGVLSLTQGQIKFPANQSASADANTLDDYEEGTWTPTVSFGGASVGVTYANNTGTYTKIGNQVCVNMYIELTNKGTSTGSALIGGLPVAIGAGVGRYGAASLWINNVTFANQIFCRYVINSSTLFLTETTEAGVTTSIDDTNFANNTEIMVTATYFV